METFFLFLAICAGNSLVTGNFPAQKASDVDADNKVHGANMGPTWVLSAPDGPHVGPMNLAIRGALMFSLISTWINSRVKNREAGNLRCHHAHYDVIVMKKVLPRLVWSCLYSACAICMLFTCSPVRQTAVPLHSFQEIIASQQMLRKLHGMFCGTFCGHSMMMSWHGKAFCITGPLWGESTGESTGLQWIPLTKSELYGALIFFLMLTNEVLSSQVCDDFRCHDAQVMSWHSCTVIS